MQPIHHFSDKTLTTIPVIHMAVANGFPPQVYAPLLHPFAQRFTTVSLPPRALWGDEDYRRFYSWQQLADDLLAGLQTHNFTDVVAIGHSFGGVASVLAALKEPQRFRGLILLDPTFINFPLPVAALVWLAQRLNLSAHLPLVQGALRRRRHFESADEAYTYFRNKRFFAEWPDETLKLYVQGITRPAEQGGVELAWSPEWEAQYYRHVFTWSWQKLPQLPRHIPLLVIRGESSDTFTAAGMVRLKRLVPQAEAQVVKGGHLFPMTNVAETQGIIATWLHNHFEVEHEVLRAP